MPKRALFPILLLAAAGAGAAPPPGFRGRVLRRDSEAGARYTETAPPGEGPGILVTWPPLQRKEVRGNRIRIAAATLPGARAFVNGREVTVFPTGAFVSLIPLRPGENSVDITTRDERGETNHRFRILKSDATEAPPPYLPFEAVRSGRTRTDGVPLFALPGRRRLTTLPAGVLLRLEGAQGDYLKVRLKDGYSAWVRKAAVRSAEGTDVPRRCRLGNVRVKAGNGGEEIFFSLDERIPFQVEEHLSPPALCLRLFGTALDTEEIRLPGGGELLKEILPEKVDDGETRVLLSLSRRAIWGWDLSPVDRGLRLLLKRPPERDRTLRGLRIAIDPGHGGEESGAVGCTGLEEKSVNLDIARRLQRQLRTAGAEALLTREEDETLSLEERVRRARALDPDLLLSVHCNSVPSASDPLECRGAETYYYWPHALPCARTVYAGLRELGLDGGGVRWKSLRVTRATWTVAVLLEIAYLSHPEEEARLMRETFRERVAESVVRSLLHFANRATMDMDAKRAN